MFPSQALKFGWDKRWCYWGYRLHFSIKASHKWRPHAKSGRWWQRLRSLTGCNQLNGRNSGGGILWISSSFGEKPCVREVTLNCTEWVCSSRSPRSTSASATSTVAATSSPLPLYDMTNSTCKRVRKHSGESDNSWRKETLFFFKSYAQFSGMAEWLWKRNDYGSSHADREWSHLLV